MQLRIKNAGVIGAGTMGAGIAAHLANCGIPSLLLDIVPSGLSEEDKARGIDTNSPKFRNRIASSALKAMSKAKLTPFYDPKNVGLITPGNLEDDFDKLADVDWIIEAIPEKLPLKQSLFERLESIHRQGQLVSSNTSGLALSEITKGRSVEFLSHVMITHFFNPPRYMYLLEVITGEHTDGDLFRALIDFSECVLGKGAVIAKDTPSFIGNRIGVFDMIFALRLAQELGLGVEEVDAIVGPLLGRPKSGLFRILDFVGLDILVHVTANLYAAADERRDVFGPIALLDKMLAQGTLGEKAGAGFYKKSRDADGKRMILTLDLKTFEYHPSSKPKFDIIKAVKKESDLSKRLHILMESEDVVGKYVWGLLSNTLCYAANRVPEISDEITAVDKALRWGFNWDKGPFELWDTIGVRYIAERLERENRNVPELVQALLESGNETFYGFEEAQPVSFAPALRCYKPIPQHPRIIILSDLKKANKIVKATRMASLIDLGDGIICVEFHSKANSITTEVLQLMQTAVEEAEKNFRGLVIGNQGANFSLGADLKEMLGFARSGQFDVLDKTIRLFHSTWSLFKYSRIPTVAAIHGMVLGGGCELSMHCDRTHAAPETHIGLVETGVGLIPGGGGCKEWVIRCSDWAEGLDGLSSFAMVNKALELIRTAKASSSAVEARSMGYLGPGDGITMNRDSLIYSAKQAAVQLAEQGYQPPLPGKDIQVLGRGGLAEFKARLNNLRQGNFISEYDEFLGNKVAYILCGGDIPDRSRVSEQHLFDLECEIFVSLMAEAKTQQRIEHTLKTGKPLRN